MSFIGNQPPLVNKAAIGLDQVDNTPDLQKPISTAVQAALDAKQAMLQSGTNIKTLNGQNILGAGDLSFTAEPVIEKMTDCGYNSLMMLVNGMIYRTNGTNAGYATALTGAEASGSQNEVGLDSLKPIVLPTGSPVIDMGDSGYSVAYALCANGQLYTWGQNANGQCGLGTTTAVTSPTLAATGVTKVFTQFNGSYDIANSKLIIQKDDGYLYGAGYNGYGQLGTGDVANKTSFTRLDAFGTNPLGVWNLGTTYGSLFVLKSDGVLMACGYNGQGQLGVGNVTATIHPTNVTSAWLSGIASPDANTIIQMAGSFDYYNTAVATNGMLCMLVNNGTTKVVKTCGYGGEGGLGNGATANISTPYTVSLPANCEEISLNCLTSVYARLATGDLYVWGRNSNGQLGLNDTTARSSPTLSAQNVARLPLRMVDAHTYGYITFMFYVGTDGKLYASGYNGNGQCGVGNVAAVNEWRPVFVPTTPTNTFKKISVYSTAGNGCYIVVGIRDDNKIFGWGYNAHNGVRSGNTSNVLTPRLFKLNLY